MERHFSALEARLQAAQAELKALDAFVSELGTDISRVAHHERAVALRAEWRKLTQALADLTLAADELLSRSQRTR